MTDQNQALLLLSKAEKDLHVLSEMTDPHRFPQEHFGFHSQQAVEKLLKAWLAHLGQEIPFTHRINLLIAQIEETGIDLQEYYPLTELNPYAVDYRYMDMELPRENLSRSALIASISNLLARVSSAIHVIPI